MQKITNQSHSTETFLYAASRALERASYYGVRAIIMLYMINNLNVSHADANTFYGIFIASIIFFQIVGAILGDLVIGNRKTMLIGGILQALGAFILCIPSIIGLCIGMGLILLGSGLYSPNILSQFGKQYLNKPMIMDSGFSIFYIAVNLGAFVGTFIVISVGDPNYKLGFIAGGILMLLSVLVSFFIKEKEEIAEATNYKMDFDKRLLTILAVILIVAVYWSVYEYSSNGFAYLDYKFTESPTVGMSNLFSTFSTAFIVPIGIIASIVWTFSYNSQLTKITAGFILGAIALIILLFLPEQLVNSSILIFVFSMFLLSLAEIHIAPILYSILTKNSNPKYLAIIISLSFVPTKIFAYGIGTIMGNSIDGMFSIKLGAIILSLIATILIIVLIVKSKKTIQMQTLSKGKIYE